jgi:hypothetical protein
MAVTAAIPITTPRMVKPARSLFFERARMAMRMVFKNDMIFKGPNWKGRLAHSKPGSCSIGVA